MNSRSFPIQRPLVFTALFFGLGITMGRYWQNNALWLPSLGLACALIFTICLYFQKMTLVYGIGFVVLFVGCIYSNFLLNPTLPPEGKYKVSAIVSGVVQNKEGEMRSQGILSDVKLINDAGDILNAGKAYWTYYPTPEMILPLDGQNILMTATLYHPMHRQNPYGFDFNLFLSQKGINIGLSGAGDFQFVNTQQLIVKNPWLRTRLMLTSLYDKLLPQGSELINALLWGDRSGILDEVEQDFRDAGIIHVLSVSGLHVGILTVTLLSFFSFLGLHPKLKFGLTAILLLFYCCLLNFNAPVFRSSVMSLVIMTAALYHQRSDPLTSLAAAFIIILAIRPLDLFHAGFQLSFLAVLGIFTLGDQMEFRFKKLIKLKKSQPKIYKVIYALQITFAASIFTAPILLKVFHRFSMVGLFFSPVACMAVAILMIYGFILLPFALIWMPLAKVMAIPLSWLIGLFTKTINAAADLPFSSMQHAAPGTISILLIFLMLILLTRYIKFRGKQRAVLIPLVLMFIIGINISRDKDVTRYILFSSGNADAAVIQDGAYTYVIDAAENGSDLSHYLLSEGRTVDTLFITHLHRDHIGGVCQLIDQGVIIKELVLPAHALETKSIDGSVEILEYAIAHGIPLRYAAKGDIFGAGHVRFDVLWPVEAKMYPNMDPNHSSMALLIDLNGVKILTAGDLTGDYERYSAHPAQILKIAHHGAKNSTQPGYLQTVRPQIAIISASSSRLTNVRAAIDRLDEYGIRLFGTQEGKALILKVKDDGETSIEYFHERGMQ